MNRTGEDGSIIRLVSVTSRRFIPNYLLSKGTGNVEEKLEEVWKRAGEQKYTAGSMRATTLHRESSGDCVHGTAVQQFGFDCFLPKKKKIRGSTQLHSKVNNQYLTRSAALG